jgi:hypothetical protein
VTGYTEEFARLMAESQAMPEHGRGRVDLLEQAAEIAESHNDSELAFEARHALIGAGLSSDQCAVMLVAFTWCLAHHDQDPERFGIHRILWEFRWVVSSLATFPEIRLAKIEEMTAEMARRYQMLGVSPRSFALMLRKMAIDMGDLKRANEAHEMLRRCPEDFLSDGPVTERGFDISFRLFRREYARAITAATPFLDRSLRSEHFEGQACADVLFPLVRANRAAEAMMYHRRGYRLRGANARHLDSIGKHISFLALTDNSDKAVRLFDKHFSAAVQTTNDFTRLKFYLELLTLFDRLVKSNIETIKLAISGGSTASVMSDARGRVSVRELHHWLLEQTKSLAERFDRRNGNTHYSNRLSELPKLQRWFRPCGLK